MKTKMQRVICKRKAAPQAERGIVQYDRTSRTVRYIPKSGPGSFIPAPVLEQRFEARAKRREEFLARQMSELAEQALSSLQTR